ncbi:MAG: hypothetical protein ACK5KQ_05410 [Anaerorhabdus sp.]
MDKLLLLIKVQLSTLFSSKKNSKLRKNKLLFYTFSAFIIIMVIGSVTYYYFNIYNFLTKETSWLLIYIVGLVLFSFTFINALMSAKGYLVNFKDYDFLMSIPVKKETAMIAKLISYFYIPLFTFFVIFIPLIILSLTKDVFNLQILVFSFIGLLTLTLISSLIGLTVVILTFKIPVIKKYPNLIQNLANLILILSIIILSSLSGTTSSSIVNNNVFMGLYNSTKNIFLPVDLMVKAIINNDIFTIVLLIMAAVVFMLVFIKIFSKMFFSASIVSSMGYTQSNYKTKKHKKKKVFFTLLTKEAKKLFGNFLYLLNSNPGILILFIAPLPIILNGELSEIMTVVKIIKNDPQIIDTLFGFTMTILLSLGHLSNSAATSISIEGKQFWIIKSLPISTWTIFNVKSSLNSMIIIVINVILLSIVSVVFSFGISMFITGLILIFLNGIFVGYLNLFINLLFPKLNFNREIEVIKQSMSSFVSIFVGFAFAAINFLVAFKTNEPILILFALYTSFLIIILLLLKYIGVKKFIRLSN